MAISTLSPLPLPKHFCCSTKAIGVNTRKVQRKISIIVKSSKLNHQGRQAMWKLTKARNISKQQDGDIEKEPFCLLRNFKRSKFAWETFSILVECGNTKNRKHGDTENRRWNDIFLLAYSLRKPWNGSQNSCTSACYLWRLHLRPFFNYTMWWKAQILSIHHYVYIF